MPRALLKGGMIFPLEPLPSEWVEGQALRIEAMGNVNEQDLDAWYHELQALVS